MKFVRVEEAQFTFFKRSLNNLGAAELYYTLEVRREYLWNNKNTIEFNVI